MILQFAYAGFNRTSAVHMEGHSAVIGTRDITQLVAAPFDPNGQAVVNILGLANQG